MVLTCIFSHLFERVRGWVLLKKLNAFNDWLAVKATDMVGSMWCAQEQRAAQDHQMLIDELALMKQDLKEDSETKALIRELLDRLPRA
jgi:hypothetical protein